MPVSELNAWIILREQIKAQHDGNGNMLMVDEVLSAFSFFYSYKKDKNLLQS